MTEPRKDWPVRWISRHGRMGFATARGTQAFTTQEEAERIGLETERYIPESALLSDEACVAAAARMHRLTSAEDGFPVVADYKLGIEAAIKAASEQ